MAAIETISFSKPEDLLNYLRRGNDHWWSDKSDQIAWVFRGQWNSEWKLTPSAWRDPVPAAFEELRKQVERLNGYFSSHAKLLEQMNIVQLNTEIEALIQFADECDANGFSVPQIEGQMRPLLLGHLSYKAMDQDDLPESAYPIAALAQHHGVPTRLLDWTDEPLIAAYFAVERSFRDISKPASCAIFAFNRLNAAAWNASPRNHLGPYTRFKMFRGSRSGNHYLKSQGGLFVAMQEPNTYLKVHSQWPDMESAVIAVSEYNQFDLPVLRKLVFPSEIADKVLKLIDREGINRARLMPTLDNVAATVKSRWQYS